MCQDELLSMRSDAPPSIGLLYPFSTRPGQMKMSPRDARKLTGMDGKAGSVTHGSKPADGPLLRPSLPSAAGTQVSSDGVSCPPSSVFEEPHESLCVFTFRARDFPG